MNAAIDDETREELRALVAAVAGTASNHASVLKTHEENFVACHRAVTSHAEAIEELRKNLHEIGERVIEQNETIRSLQQAMVKVLNVLAIDDGLETKDSKPN